MGIAIFKIYICVGILSDLRLEIMFYGFAETTYLPKTVIP